jgi:hypothetical protein
MLKLLANFSINQLRKTLVCRKSIFSPTLKANYPFIIDPMKWICSLLLLLVFQSANAQKILPAFTVTDLQNNKVIISWNNQFGKTLTTINVQRSYDSLKGYTSIFSAQSPELPENGYVDSKAPYNRMFYRLFYVLEGGLYYFSKPKRPEIDTSSTFSSDDGRKPIETISKFEIKAVRDSSASFVIPSINTSKPIIIYEEKLIVIKVKDSVLTLLTNGALKRFKDSLNFKTKDTLVAISADTLLIKRYIPVEVFKPSLYIFTNKEGNLNINLPDFATKKYAIKFFEDKTTTEVFLQIPLIKDNPLIMEKVNFQHAGWFWFELYEDGKLKERHKFFLRKDF